MKEDHKRSEDAACIGILAIIFSFHKAPRLRIFWIKSALYVNKYFLILLKNIDLLCFL